MQGNLKKYWKKNLKLKNNNLSMKAKELRQKSTEELIQLLNQLREKLMQLKMKKEAGMPLENPMEIRNTKRDIARILTILREREIKL